MVEDLVLSGLYLKTPGRCICRGCWRRRWDFAPANDCVRVVGGNMPSPISLPPCLMDCYKVLYPNLGFSRITFYEGMPAVAGSPEGFTMAPGGPDINIYVREYLPCSKDTFLTIAHELVHAVQIQGM